MMDRITEIQLTNFQGFRGCDAAVETDADVVLITGRNGSGKTSLLRAITLYLNGYDPNLLKKVSIKNVFAPPDSPCGVLLIGLAGTELPVSPSTEADWRNWQSPFETSRTSLNPAIARVATSFFQDKAKELASAEFLSYLTGAGNQGQEVMNWLKDRKAAWKTRSDRSRPNEKDWDHERKNILSKVLEIGQEAPADCHLSNQFKDFVPLITNRNLAKHWMSQVANLANRFATKDTNYGPALLREFIQELRAESKHLEEENDRLSVPQTKNADDTAKLRAFLQEENDQVSLLTAADFSATEDAISVRATAIARLYIRQAELRVCEPKSPSLEELLNNISQNAEDADKEAQRLQTTAIPIPDDIVEFFRNLQEANKEGVETTYNHWRNTVSEALAKIAQEISIESKGLGQLEKQLEISKLVESNPKTRNLLSGQSQDLRKTDIVNALGANAEGQSPQIQPMTEAEGLKRLSAVFTDLLQLEEEFEVERHEKTKMKSFSEAKDFAKDWSEAFTKEAGIGGVFSKLLNELDLNAVIGELKTLLAIFHLPREFMANIAINRKGTGRNARLIPALNQLDFNDLSTGQKTLFALGWTIVLNNSLRSKLGHNVMLFDDITTSLDLNQIVPACVLFRKLAYTPSDSKRRQLFISSHHEDLTNHLIDNLIPPEGRSLRILEFSEFSVDDGPEIDGWNVATAKS